MFKEAFRHRWKMNSWDNAGEHLCDGRIILFKYKQNFPWAKRIVCCLSTFAALMEPNILNPFRKGKFFVLMDLIYCTAPSRKHQEALGCVLWCRSRDINFSEQPAKKLWNLHNSIASHFFSIRQHISSFNGSLGDSSRRQRMLKSLYMTQYFMQIMIKSASSSCTSLHSLSCLRDT